MKKITCLVVSLIALSIIAPISANAASKTGTPCPAVGKTTTVSGQQYVCKKTSGKLKWAAAGLPECSPNTIYDLRDIIAAHDDLLSVPDDVQAYIKEMQRAYADAVSWGQMSNAAQAQMNIQSAVREAQIAMANMAKLERQFKDITATCKATGVYMSYRYIN
jgi:hypothetical protein